MTQPVTIRVVDHDDTAALERHVAFEQVHGRARFTVDGLRAFLPTVDAALLLAAEDAGGVLVGCASASVVAALRSSVQLNGFCRPGEGRVLRQLVDAVAEWEAAADADTLIAHVSDPTREQEQSWLHAGFTRVGTRARVELRPTLGALPDAPLPAGVEIVPLAQRPELAQRALEVWNECHTDIPSVLPFDEQDERAWHQELEIHEGIPIPRGCWSPPPMTATLPG